MAEIIGIFPHWGQAPEPLWREVLGRRLRALRADRDETLAQTAERAGISPQYLSEIERGRKEASSEMIAALAGALEGAVDGRAGHRARPAAAVRPGRPGPRRLTAQAGQRPVRIWSTRP